MAGDPRQAEPGEPASSESARAAAPNGWVLAPREGGSALAGREVRIFGLSPAERMRRALARAGARPVEVLAAGSAPPRPGSGSHLVARGDCVVDERLIGALRDRPGSALCATPERSLREIAIAAHVGARALPAAVQALREDRTPPGVALVRALELVPAWDPTLRRVGPPYVLLPRAEDARSVEVRVFAASYKGLTDLVTRWVWPLPARAVTRWCARRGISPNAVTAASYALVAVAAALFAEGRFGAGLAAAWAMTFLDTVDGKLARVTLRSSRLGGALDHGLDLVHPPLWWWAWAAGLANADPAHAAAAWAAMAIVVGGYLLGRALEGVFLATFRFEIFLWRPFDGAFRTVIARRNPNLLLLTAGVLAGRPDGGYAAVAAWTLASNAVHAVRVAQALGRRRRGEPVAPWGAAPA
jgi:phosphatidylglycerophosphate synthase